MHIPVSDTGPFKAGMSPMRLIRPEKFPRHASIYFYFYFFFKFIYLLLLLLFGPRQTNTLRKHAYSNILKIYHQKVKNFR